MKLRLSSLPLLSATFYHASLWRIEGMEREGQTELNLLKAEQKQSDKWNVGVVMYALLFALFFLFFFLCSFRSRGIFWRKVNACRVWPVTAHLQKCLPRPQLWILCFVDRASRYKRVKKNQLDAQLILSIFRQPLHVSGISRTIIRRYNQIYTKIWYLLFFLDDCLLCWLGWSSNPTRTTDSHLERIISTKCCVDTVVPPDDRPRCARNM